MLLRFVPSNLAYGRQTFMATLLFDPPMSALPIILNQNSVRVGLFTHYSIGNVSCLDRHETG